MSSETYETGATTVVPTLYVEPGSGEGFIELGPQSVAPSAPPAGSKRIYADADGNFVFMPSNGQPLSFNLSALTAPRTVRFPDALGTLVTDDSTSTLTNKTIIGNTNTVEATVLAGESVTGSPSDGQFLQFNTSSWQPASLTATGPISLTNNDISVAVGTTAGTVAAGDDGRFAVPQLITVKKGTPGVGEFSSIAAAIASITDASAAKPYVVRVGPGVYIESTITMKPYVYLQGLSMFPVIVRPNAPGITLFRLTSASSIEEITIAGLGSGVGIHSDSAQGSLIGNVVATGFATCFLFTSAAGASDILLHEFVTFPPFSVGVHVDGRAVSSSHDLSVSISTGRVRCGPSTTIGVSLEGPYANVSANSVRSVQASAGIGMYMADGAFVELGNSKITDCDTGMVIANVGAGPTIRFRDILFIDNTTIDVDIKNPGTNGIFDGIADRTKTFINNAANVSVSYRDPENPANILRGEFIYAPTNDTVLTETGSLFVQTADVGVYEGGNVSVFGGLTVRTTAGSGYIIGAASVDYVRKITWAQTDTVLPASSVRYIYANETGIQQSASIPDLVRNVLLARVVTRSNAVVFVDSQRQSNFHANVGYTRSARSVSGPVYASGSLVSIGAGNTIDVGSGEYFYLFNRFTPPGGTGISVTTYRRDGSEWINAGATAISANYDGGSGLVAIPVGKYVRHELFIVSSDTVNRYLFVYGQTLYNSIEDAKTNDGLVVPNYFAEGVVRIAGIVAGSAGLNSVVDLRPISGRTFASSGATATNHGNLVGLLDDDHPQYLPVNGSRPLEANMNMGGFSINNASTINGVDICCHAFRHVSNGADPLPTAAPTVNLTSTTTNTEGTANSFARSDHTHRIDASGFDINALGGTLSVAKGGTGRTSLTVGKFIAGNGTSAVTMAKTVPNGEVVGDSDAQTLSNKLLAASTVFSGTGTVAVTAGGTSSTTLVAGATSPISLNLPRITTVLVGRDTADTLTNKSITGGQNGNNVSANNIRSVNIAAAAPAVGQYLIATGTSSAAWAPLNVGNSVSGVLGVANGGTGATILPPGKVIIGNGTGTVNTAKDAPTGAFVGTTDAQTLTNKLLASATTRFVGTVPTDTLAVVPSGACTVTFTGMSVITMPAGTNTLVGRSTVDVLTNKTIDDVSNTVVADRMRVSGGTVSTSGSAAPNAGDRLVATSSTTAEWQTPADVFTDAAFSIGDVIDNTIAIKFNASGATNTSTTIVANQSANITLALPSMTDTIVGRNTTDTLTAKTLILPTIASIFNSGILTLPAGPETLVGRDTIDTLTRKTLVDNSTTIMGAASTIEFAAAGTGNSRTLLQSGGTSDIVLFLPTTNDTIVGRVTTDTLANKTLDMPTTVIAGASGRNVNFSSTGAASSTLTLNSAATANRTLTFPDTTDVIVSRSSTDVLSNKTIIGGSNGNTVATNQIGGVTVNGTPNVGYLLSATSTTTAQWTSPAFGATSPKYIFGYQKVSRNSASWQNVTDSDPDGIIAFPGTAELPLVSMTVVVENGNASTAGEVRLFDKSNNNQLATIAIPSGTTSPTPFTTSVFVNTPVNFAMLQIQVRRTGGNASQITACGWYIRCAL